MYNQYGVSFRNLNVDITWEAYRVKIQEVFSKLPEITGITGGFHQKYRQIFTALKIQAKIVILQELQAGVPGLPL